MPRELIEPHKGDKRYVRRKESSSVRRLCVLSFGRRTGNCLNMRWTSNRKS
jgi:hypothetical protein